MYYHILAILRDLIDSLATRDMSQFPLKSWFLVVAAPDSAQHI